MMGEMATRWSLWLVAVLECSCWAGERARPRSPVTPSRALVDLGMRERNSLEITARGQLHQLEFHFVDCTTGRPPTWITEIIVVRENQTVCLTTSPERSLPPIWEYGASVGGQSGEKCDPLTPGLYGIKVYGGEKGQAEFEIAADGTVSMKGLTCASLHSK